MKSVRFRCFLLGVERVTQAVCSRFERYEISDVTLLFVVLTEEHHRVECEEKFVHRFASIDFVLQEDARCHRLLGIGNARVIGCLLEWSDEEIVPSRRIIADGHCGKGLRSLDHHRDRGLRSVLEIGLDCLNDEVEHHRREDQERDGPEERVGFAVGTSDARQTVRGCTEGELANDGTASRP